jgi:hypothetical protein
VRLLLNGELIGEVTVRTGFHACAFPISAALAASAATREEPATLRIESTVWSPRTTPGRDRQPNCVMVDTVTVR